MQRILAVDDDKFTLELVLRAFESDRFAVDYSENGLDALEKVRTQRPDLVILDITMPGMDGYQVCRRIKGDPDLASVMVLMLSARSALADRLEGYDANADDYLIKPFDFMELKAKARILLRLKAAQDELAALNRSQQDLIDAKTRELVAREREAIYGQLVQGIIHNLKGPLSVVQLKADLAKQLARDVLDAQTLSDEAHRPFLDRIVSHQIAVIEAAGRIDQLICNLLEKGRHESLKRRVPIDLNDLIQRELTFLESDPEFKHEIAKHWDLAPDLPNVRGVYADFSQVVYNLVQNAVEAMRDQSRKELGIHTSCDNGYVYVEISDTGPGIAPEHLDRIFESHFTTKVSSDKPVGCGLGLFVCNRLMEAYGAGISVRSHPDQGTVFTLAVPRDTARLVS